MKNYNKQYRMENADIIADNRREYYLSRREMNLAKCKEYYAANKQKIRDRVQKYKKRVGVKEAELARFRRKKYGVTAEQLNAMALSQNSSCAICLAIFGSKAFHVDHDHGTGKVRGLLCAGCNVGIGRLRDSSRLLRLAADYIDGNS